MAKKKDVKIKAPLYGVKPLPSDRIYQEYICQRSDGKLTLTTKDKEKTFDGGFDTLESLLDFHQINKANITETDSNE